MALPATDTFTTGADANLATYSSNWTQNAGLFTVLAASDDVHPNDSSDFVAHWNADTFSNDQYAQVVINAVASNQFIGPAVRVHASANTGYLYEADSDNERYVAKIVTGSWTELGSSTTPFSAGQTARLEVQGTTITPKINGVLDSGIGAQSDSAISSGYGGMCGFGTSTSARMDNWEGGNIGAAAAAQFMTTNRGFW